MAKYLVIMKTVDALRSATQKVSNPLNVSGDGGVPRLIPAAANNANSMTNSIETMIGGSLTAQPGIAGMYRRLWSSGSVKKRYTAAT